MKLVETKNRNKALIYKRNYSSLRWAETVESQKLSLSQ